MYAPLQKGSTTYETACALGESSQEKGKSCNSGLGSAVFVTGTIGFMAAAEVINFIADGKTSAPYGWVERRADRLAREREEVL